MTDTTLPKPIQGKNPLCWPRLCLLDIMLNGGIWSDILAWSIILVWVFDLVDLIINIFK